MVHLQIADPGRVPDQRLELFRLAGLGNVLMGHADALIHQGSVRMARQHDPHGGRVQALDLPQELGTVHPWHPHIGNDHIEGRPLQGPQPLSGAFAEGHLPFRSHARQHPPQPAQDIGLIIDEQDARLHVSAPRGMRMMNVVPCPGRVSKVRLPPCFSTITDRAMNRPWPVP